MEKTRATADRIRPILRAMERSIESARNRRLEKSDQPRETGQFAPSPVTRETESTPPAPPATVHNSDEPTRLKARPKRPNGTFGENQDPSHQRRAV